VLESGILGDGLVLGGGLSFRLILSSYFVSELQRSAMVVNIDMIFGRPVAYCFWIGFLRDELLD
jgi:hypothetical protein